MTKTTRKALGNKIAELEAKIDRLEMTPGVSYSDPHLKQLRQELKAVIKEWSKA